MQKILRFSKVEIIRIMRSELGEEEVPLNSELTVSTFNGDTDNPTPLMPLAFLEIESGEMD